ncbi:hypothetical protein HPB47_018190, partial [Ixodes persulcatus]
IRQTQTGTLLTPHLLQRFRENVRAGSSTAFGICKNCNSKADLVHLMRTRVSERLGMPRHHHIPQACFGALRGATHLHKRLNGASSGGPASSGYSQEDTASPSLVDEGPEAMKCCPLPPLLFFDPRSLIPYPPSNGPPQSAPRKI